jgi:hypothetical protein
MNHNYEEPIKRPAFTLRQVQIIHSSLIHLSAGDKEGDSELKEPSH